MQSINNDGKLKGHLLFAMLFFLKLHQPFLRLFIFTLYFTGDHKQRTLENSKEPLHLLLLPQGTYQI